MIPPGDGEQLADQRTLVVSVGLSPLPPALSVLTLRPRRVILVHSAASAPIAGRITDAVRARSALDENEPPIIQSVELADAKVKDFSGLHAALGTASAPSRARTLRSVLGTTRAFMLDYTGGTKVMVACLVEFHLAWHRGDAPWLRCYISLANNYVQLDAGRTAKSTLRRALYDRLTLAERVRLHGFELQGVRRKESPSPETAEAILSWRRAGAGAPDPAAVRKFKSAVGDYLRGGKPVAFPPVGETAVGDRAECLAAEALIRVDSDRLSSTELYLSAEVRDPGGPRRSEFDLLWRYRNVVVVIEVKTADNNNSATRQNNLASLATRVTYTERVLGSAAVVVFWALSTTEEGVQQQIFDLNSLVDTPLLGNVRARMRSIEPVSLPLPEPNRADAIAEWLEEFRSGSCVDLADTLDNLIRAYESDGPDLSAGEIWPILIGVEPLGGIAQPAEFPVSAASEVMVGAVGGSPLAVMVGEAIGSMSLRPLGAREFAYRALIDGDPLHCENLDDYRSVKGVLARQECFAYYITPSTKASASAMTVQAATSIPRRDLLYVDQESDRVVSRSGHSFLWSDREIDWAHFLSTISREFGVAGLSYAAARPANLKDIAQHLNANANAKADATSTAPALRGAMVKGLAGLLFELAELGYTVLLRANSARRSPYPVAVVGGKRKVLAFVDPFLHSRAEWAQNSLLLQQMIIDALFGDGAATGYVMGESAYQGSDLPSAMERALRDRPGPAVDLPWMVEADGGRRAMQAQGDLGTQFAHWRPGRRLLQPASDLLMLAKVRSHLGDPPRGEKHS